MIVQQGVGLEWQVSISLSQQYWQLQVSTCSPHTKLRRDVWNEFCKCPPNIKALYAPATDAKGKPEISSTVDVHHNTGILENAEMMKRCLAWPWWCDVWKDCCGEAAVCVSFSNRTVHCVQEQSSCLWHCKQQRGRQGSHAQPCSALY